MNTSENFCLKWNDFSGNILSTFSDLRNDKEYHDVTLACEDGTQIEAHKVVLTAGSMFFRNILRNRKKDIPIIYMRGLKSSDLNAILDFLYHGEVNIFQNDLEYFLSLAVELQLKGLDGGGEKENEYSKDPQISKQNIKTNIDNESDNNVGQNSSKFPNNEYMTDKEIKQNHDRPLVPENYHQESRPFVSVTGNDDLEQKMTELIEWTGENWRCTQCGKLSTNTGLGKSNLKRHTQIHMEGLSFPCNLCGKEFRCSNNFTTHMYRSHKSV